MSDEVSYSLFMVVIVNGKRIVFALTCEVLVALQLMDGHMIFRHFWCPRESALVSAATPLVVEDMIFLLVCYGVGVSLFRFKESGLEEIWSRDDVLSNHYATSVCYGGFLYGWHGRQEQGCAL